MEIDNSSILVQIDELNLDELLRNSPNENDLSTINELEQMLETETVHTSREEPILTIPYTEKPLN